MGITISHGYRFYEIFHQDHNISQLKIAQDFTQESQKLMVVDIMRY